MITVIAEERIYNNGIENFIIQEIHTGDISEITKDEFKEALKYGKIECVNYKLTSNGKLVQRSKIETNRILDAESIIDRSNSNSSWEPQMEFRY